MTTGRKIVLIGPMGAGKTSLGKRLAARLRWDFVDTDHALCARTGVDIPTIFAQEGEAGFRRREHATLVAELADPRERVVACGGGGIPVMRNGNHLKGASAVIDKDFGSELIAENLEADYLIILTAVEKVAINYRKPNEEWLDELTPEEARRYIAEGQFAPGSMLPKVEAAIRFAESAPGRTALITLLEKARDSVLGKTGTQIHT